MAKAGKKTTEKKRTKKKAQPEKSLEKKRGFWLTAWLVLMIIANFFSAMTYLLFQDLVLTLEPNLPVWLLYLYGILSVAGIIFAIFLFSWKKWPFYAICGIAILLFGLNVWSFGIISALSGPLGVLFLYLLMRPKWAMFT